MTEPIDQTADADEVTGENPPVETETPADDQPNPNREAARYRTQLRETEAALAAANARLEQLHRLDIERIASAGLSHPSDLFTLSGNSAADYLTEDGYVDAERVAADVAAILSERPGMRKLAPAVDRTQGSGNVAPGKSAPTWGALLQP
jgi:hypothetical protein